MEDWAEIRRLHRAEGLPIKMNARTLGVSRNTVRAALAAEGPPKYVRRPTGSAVDDFEQRKIPEPNQAAPIGELVRMHLPQIVARCQANPEEFANLQDKTYYLATFRQSYPVLAPKPSEASTRAFAECEPPAHASDDRRRRCSGPSQLGFVLATLPLVSG